MKTLNIHEAKTHFSRLLQDVAGGEEIIIARAGKPIARILPVDEAPTRRRPGNDRTIRIAEDFDAPLAEFEG
jgi:prevent-host-death family protein